MQTDRKSRRNQRKANRPNQITGANAAERRQLSVRTRWPACIAQFRRSAMHRVVCICAIAFTSSCSRELPIASQNPDIERLVDQLTEIDAQAPGLHSTAWVRGFIAEEKPDEFAGGVLGSAAPKRFPQMEELVRRGVVAMPSLIQHLGDKRPTKLTVGGDIFSGGFFTFGYFGDEYDPKSHSQRGREQNTDRLSNPKYQIPNLKYTVCVGDVCYALIGQIVNRSLLPVGYQPTAGLVVNSPLHERKLITKVKRDWGDIDTNAHKASLLADLRSTDPWLPDSALQRLHFHYPDEYLLQRTGKLKAKIESLEASEKMQ